MRPPVANPDALAAAAVPTSPEKSKRSISIIIDTWSIVASVAGLLVATLTAIIWQPPFDFGNSDTLPSAARYAVAVVTGLLAYPILSNYRRKYNVFWTALTVTMTLVGLALLYQYYRDTALWVRSMQMRSGETKQFVIGDTLSVPARTLMLQQANHGRALTDTGLLAFFPAKFPDNVYEIWDRREIADHELTLAALYISTIFSFSVVMIGVVQCLRSGAEESL